MHESQMHDQSWFATLTYDEDHVPRNGSLDYTHFQDFVRRARKRLGRFRFYMAGEYGGQTARPHYHACLFGIRIPDVRYYRSSPSGHTLFRSDVLDGLWKLGLCSFGALTFESAAYVARYVCKKVTGDAAKDHYQRVDPSSGEVFSVVPEFARMSLRPGIGASWFAKWGRDCLPRDYVVMDGHKVPVPKFYRGLYRVEDPFGSDWVDFERQQKADAFVSDRTPERLRVREEVAAAKAAFSSRKL